MDAHAEVRREAVEQFPGELRPQAFYVMGQLAQQWLPAACSASSAEGLSALRRYHLPDSHARHTWPWPPEAPPGSRRRSGRIQS